MGNAREGCAQAVANQTGAQGLSSVVMDTGCMVSGAVMSQQTWYRGKTVMSQRRNPQLATVQPLRPTLLSQL